MYGNNFNYGFNQPSMPYLPDYRQAQQAQMSNVAWVYVNGIEGARNQIVQPNQVAWMMDNSEPRIYVKAVDNVGSVTLRAFALNEIDTNSLTTGAREQSAYVTRNDLSALENRIAHIEQELGGIES